MPHSLLLRTAGFPSMTPLAPLVSFSLSASHCRSRTSYVACPITLRPQPNTEETTSESNHHTLRAPPCAKSSKLNATLVSQPRTFRRPFHPNPTYPSTLSCGEPKEALTATTPRDVMPRRSLTTNPTRAPPTREAEGHQGGRCNSDPSSSQAVPRQVSPTHPLMPAHHCRSPPEANRPPFWYIVKRSPCMRYL